MLYEVVSGEMVTVDEVEQVLPTQTVAVPLTAPLEEVLVTVIVTEDELVEIALIRPWLVTVTVVESELLHAVPEDVVMFWVVPSL